MPCQAINTLLSSTIISLLLSQPCTRSLAAKHAQWLAVAQPGHEHPHSHASHLLTTPSWRAPAGSQPASSTPRGSGTPSQATKKERERASFYQSLRKKQPAAEAGQPSNGLAYGDRSISLASEASELLDSPAAGAQAGNGHSYAENGAASQVGCPGPDQVLG